MAKSALAQMVALKPFVLEVNTACDIEMCDNSWLGDAGQASGASTQTMELPARERSYFKNLNTRIDRRIYNWIRNHE